MIELIEMLQSSKIKDREIFLRFGAEIDKPAFTLLYNQELGRETYQKILLTQDGQCETTNCPVGLLLMCENWRVFEMRGDNAESLFIAYHPDADVPNSWYSDIAYNPAGGTKNSWYSDLAKRFPLDMKVKRLNGDLVVFKHNRSLHWNELELRRELLNWLVMKYRYKKAYKFCD